MRYVSIAIALAVFSTLAALSQVRPQPPVGRPGSESAAVESTEPAERSAERRGSSPRPGDPFNVDLAQALRAEAGWLTLHEALMEEFDTLSPCDAQALARVIEARDAAFEVFAKRTAYLQKHVQHATELRKRIGIDTTKLGVDRGDLEASARQIAQELEAARKRRAALSDALAERDDTGDEAPPQQVLDQLIGKLEREAALVQDTLREFDRSRDHLRGLQRWARERERMAKSQLDLINAESRLWKAFYDGLSYRLELSCAQTRPRIYEFTTTNPREIRR